MHANRSHSLRLRWITDAAASSFLAERERWSLWAPVLIGCGIAAYFVLPIEPEGWVGAALLIGSAAALWLGRRYNVVAFLALALGLLASGFSVAQLRTHLVAAPVLERPMTAALSGRVRHIEAFARGPRVLLDEIALRNLPAERTPERVRIRLRAADVPAIGSRIVVFARLLPPGGPAAPGAYDFQRRAWFARIGAVGFAYGLTRLENAAVEVRGRSFAIWISSLRQRIAERIRLAIPGENGAVAAALITGDRSAISQVSIQAMRDSGLAHLLAISGLHMGLVVATLFFGLRALLALSERIALRYPIKKWTAGAALLGGFAYLMLAGATIPTQRAFLMVGLVLAAVFLDRTAISLRLVAWAAAAILLTTPESLLSASFQMSFAAVVALVAVYEIGQRRIGAWARAGIVRKVALYFAGVSLTTLVAGFSTGVFALYHFGRIAHFGLVANLLAVPITAFWIMPWAVIAMALFPFGLEGIALIPMAWGIELVIGIAKLVAGWPGAVSLTPAMPVYGLAAAAFGGLWLCLWQRRWRYLGIAGIVAGLASIPFYSGPDILISSDGRLMAVCAADGKLLLSTTRREKQTARSWLNLTGQRELRSWQTVSVGITCDALSCIYEAKGRRVALVSDPRALAEDCRRASVVISAVPVRWNCPFAQLVIDRFDLWRLGGHAIRFTREGPLVTTVVEQQGRRPWTPQRRTVSKADRG